MEKQHMTTQDRKSQRYSLPAYEETGRNDSKVADRSNKDIFKVPHHLCRRLQCALATPRLFHLLTTSQPQRKLRQTACLDGLRGCAAIVVCIQHFSDTFYVGLHRQAFEGDLRHNWARLPMIRTLYSSGHLALNVFFVSGGFVLTRESLNLIRRGELDLMYKKIAINLLRRPIRLFVPMLLNLSLILCLILLGVKDPTVTIFPTATEQISHWTLETIRLLDVFRQVDDDRINSYNLPMWSIPVEYYHGILCYVVLLVISRSVTYRVRSRILSSLLVWSIAFGKRCTTPFLCGIILADYDIEFPWQRVAHTGLRDHVQRLLNISIGLVLWFLAGCVEDPAVAPGSMGFRYLAIMTPTSWKFNEWWTFVAASVLVHLTLRRLGLRQFFEHRFCQYLGSVSFAVYMIHLPFFHLTWGPWFRDTLPALLGNFHLAVLAFALITPPVLLVSAEIWANVATPIAEHVLEQFELAVTS